MIKKTIKFEDYNGNEVEEDFYFNLTKLELLEEDLEAGGLEETAKKLMETEDAKKAYGLFKDIILRSVGVKSDDGRRFIKSQEIRDDFENSPALAELIISFLQDATVAADFVKGLLPQKLVQEAQDARKSTGDAEVVQLPEPKEEKSSELKFEDYSREDLLTMPQAEFQKLVPANPIEMTKDQLLIAMQRKSGDHSE